MLCEKEAGDFVFKTVENVEGLYFARPPKKPSDQDLMDRWKLEDPSLESIFQQRETPDRRAVFFIDPPVANYSFYEEPKQDSKATLSYLRLSGHQDGIDYQENGKWKRIPEKPWVSESISQLSSRYALIWRGIHRPHDRENGIAGGELIIYDISSNAVLGVLRNYAFGGGFKNTTDGVWWLGSRSCKQLVQRKYADRAGLIAWPSKVLKPAK
jgi:hypothetical protein